MKMSLITLVAIALAVPAGAVATDRPAPKPVPTPRVAAAKGTPRAADGAVDRLQLDPTAITGNRELPKVMSIVPWKGAEPPGSPDRPMGSLIEEVLAPVDRDEFRREITYFRDLTSQSPTVQPSPSPGAIQP
jgi:hypothetical protein